MNKISSLTKIIFNSLSLLILVLLVLLGNSIIFLRSQHEPPYLLEHRWDRQRVVFYDNHYLEIYNMHDIVQIKNGKILSSDNLKVDVDSQTNLLYDTAYSSEEVAEKKDYSIDSKLHMITENKFELQRRYIVNDNLNGNIIIKMKLYFGGNYDLITLDTIYFNKCVVKIGYDDIYIIEIDKNNQFLIIGKEANSFDEHSFNLEFEVQCSE